MKTARMKISMTSDTSDDDITLMKALLEIADKLYIYIDDRDDDYFGINNSDNNDINDIIETKLDSLEEYGIQRALLNVIKYTDYYNIAWIYLHRLASLEEAIIDQNTNYHHADLKQILLNKQIIKIHLALNSNENNKCTTLLYDSGWFRLLFLELVIDDSEKVDYSLDQSEMINTNMATMINANMVTINQQITEKLTTLLQLHRPMLVQSLRPCA